MYFKRDLLIQGLEAFEGWTWHVELLDDHQMTLEFKQHEHRLEEALAEFRTEAPLVRLSESSGELEYFVSFVALTVKGTWEVGPKIEEILNRAKTGELKLPHLPHEWQDTFSSIDASLMEVATRFTDLLRWRFGILGDLNPLRGTNLEWRTTNGDWRTFHELKAYQRVSEPIQYFGPELAYELAQRGINDAHIPLGHSLLREAWDLRNTNPRSALVIGVAAAEVGFKQFAVDLDPKMVWLIEDHTMPPLGVLLQKYLPVLLEGDKRFEHTSLPKALIAEINNANEMRNVIAHKPPTARRKHSKLQSWIDEGGLPYALMSIADLLSYLDFYRGEQWALANVRLSTFNWLGDSDP